MARRRKKSPWQIEGLEELGNKIQQMMKVASPDVVEPITLKAAKMIRLSAWARAPRGPTGNLQRSIVAKQLKRRGRPPAPAMVGIDYRIGPHAHLVEFGTSKMPAYPFFRPAVNYKGPEALAMVEREIASHIEKAAR